MVAKLILFLFLAFLPFGQIIRIPVFLSGNNFYLNFSDALALSALIASFFSRLKYPNFWKSVKDFLIVAGFSLVASLSFFTIGSVILGSFYLLRLISYFFLFLTLLNLLKKNLGFKDTVFKGLILSTSFVAVFGWLQYLIYPDLRSLLYFGWDEHLLRMVGGFLDPTFTGILLVFGAVLSIFYYFKTKKTSVFLTILFLLVSLAFTFSRSSYLSFYVGLAGIFALTKKIRELVFFGIFFGLIVFLLPAGEGEGVKLERTASAFAKLRNYQDSLTLTKVSPIFGIGYNNTCLSRRIYLDEADADSHSCSGLDASFLFLLVTTGILGIFSFVNLISTLVKNIGKDIFGRAFVVCGLALLSHSLFANSLFYSWILGYMAILLALAVKART